LATLMLVAPLAAQSVLGTWTATGPTGVVTLTLRSTGGTKVSGALTGKGTAYQVQGQLQQGTFMGEATGSGLRTYVEAMAQGDNLVLVLADYGPGGVPNTAGANQISFTRAAGAAPSAPKAGSIVGDLVGKAPTKSSADPFVGRFSSDQATITLERSGASYQGAFLRAGQQAPIQAKGQGKGLAGTIQDTNGATYLFTLTPQGQDMALIISGKTFLLRREDNQEPGRPAASDAVGGPGSIGRTATDQQMAQLLLGSRWCNFTYNQRTGTSHKETVSLSRDGILTVSDGTETYSSGYAGTVAGSYQGGKRYYWRIQGGLLHLSQDGTNWAPQPGSVQVNSAGHPIITSGGKEYTRCN
jgi:hypothetical protein